MSDSLPEEGVFACNLAAMNAEQRQQHQRLISALFPRHQEVRELPDGYGLRWEKEKLALAAEFILLERLCCPFFDFRLSIAARSDWFWMDITGQAGVKAFIVTEFGDNLVPAHH